MHPTSIIPSFETILRRLLFIRRSQLFRICPFILLLLRIITKLRMIKRKKKFIVLVFFIMLTKNYEFIALI